MRWSTCQSHLPERCRTRCSARQSEDRLHLKRILSLVAFGLRHRGEDQPRSTVRPCSRTLPDLSLGWSLRRASKCGTSASPPLPEHRRASPASVRKQTSDYPTATSGLILCNNGE